MDASGFWEKLSDFVISDLRAHHGIFPEERIDGYIEYLRSHYKIAEVLQQWKCGKQVPQLLPYPAAIVCVQQFLTPTKLAWNELVTVPTTVRLTAPSLDQPIVFSTHYPHTLYDEKWSSILSMIYCYTSPSYTTSESWTQNEAITYQAFGLVAFVLNHAVRANKPGHYKDNKDLPYPSDTTPTPASFDCIEEFLPIVNLWNLDMNLVDVEREVIFGKYTEHLHRLWKHELITSSCVSEFFVRSHIETSSLMQYAERILFQLTRETPLWAMLRPQQQKVLTNYVKLYLGYLKMKYNTDTNLLEAHIAQKNTTLNQMINFLPAGVICPRLEYVPTSEPESDTPFHWPLYTAKATDEDKKTFEDYLSQLCKSNRKKLTQEIKSYLKMKEEQGIINRPNQLNIEYEYIQRFGYSRAIKTYYN